MKKLTSLALMIVIICLGLTPANADILFYSGDNGYNIAGINSQSPGIAVMKTIPYGGWHVDSLTFYIGETSPVGPNFIVAYSIYPNIVVNGYDQPDAAHAFSTSIVSNADDGSVRPHSVSLNQYLPAGKTWFSLEMADGATDAGVFIDLCPYGMEEVSLKSPSTGWSAGVAPDTTHVYLEIQGNPTPIPASVLLLGSGLLGLAGWRRFGKN